MVPDLTLEAIYFGVPTDFKMEFKLCGICNIRFLSASVKDNKSFLMALQKSVGRSRVIVTVGGFDGENYLPKIVARATGMDTAPINSNELISDINEKYVIPKGAVPLISTKGNFRGLVIEKGDQAIIMLSEDKTERYEILDTLVCPYIRLLVDKKSAGFSRADNFSENRNAGSVSARPVQGGGSAGGDSRLSDGFSSPAAAPSTSVDSAAAPVSKIASDGADAAEHALKIAAGLRGGGNAADRVKNNGGSISSAVNIENGNAEKTGAGAESAEFNAQRENDPVKASDGGAAPVRNAFGMGDVLDKAAPAAKMADFAGAEVSAPAEIGRHDRGAKKAGAEKAGAAASDSGAVAGSPAQAAFNADGTSNDAKNFEEAAVQKPETKAPEKGAAQSTSQSAGSADNENSAGRQTAAEDRTAEPVSGVQVSVVKEKMPGDPALAAEHAGSAYEAQTPDKHNNAENEGDRPAPSGEKPYKDTGESGAAEDVKENALPRDVVSDTEENDGGSVVQAFGVQIEDKAKNCISSSDGSSLDNKDGGRSSAETDGMGAGYDIDQNNVSGTAQPDKNSDSLEQPLGSEEKRRHSRKNPEKTTVMNILENKAPPPAKSPADYTVLRQPGEFDMLDELSFEVKPEPKKRRAIKALIAIILVAAVVLGALFGYRFLYEPTQGDSIYKSIVSLYGKTTEISVPPNLLPEFGRLYEMNPDIAGFITVPNTNINYPVVRTSAAGSVYCDSHLFDGTFNNFGTPYTYANVDGTTYNRNIVINGKTVYNDKMFSDLEKYTDFEFYRTAPLITFDTIYAPGSYKVFSVLQFEQSSIEYQKTNFFDDEDFLNFLNTLQNASLIKTPVDLLGTDQIITLVTKDGGTTTVVCARAVRSGESPLVDVTGSSLNLDADMTPPDESSSNYSGGLVDLGPNDNISGGRYEQNIISSPFDINVSNIFSSDIFVNSSAPGGPTASVTTSSTPVSADRLPTLYVRNASDSDTRVSGNALDILARVVEAEMGSRYEPEALKAQAVSAYGWLLCSGAADGKSYPSVPMKNASSKSIEAVKAVAGIVAVYGGKVAQTFYFDTSAGRTANAADIWGGNYPYLKSVDSSVDKNSTAYPSTNTYKASDIQKWVLDAWDIDLSKISDKNSWFKPTYDSNNLYVKEISVGGVTKRGSHLRTYVLTSANCGSGNGLRSPAYTIKYNAQSDTFTFNVKGYGHGVGLSQTGANEYAKAGWDYERILKHYFSGISLGTYYVN